MRWGEVGLAHLAHVELSWSEVGLAHLAHVEMPWSGEALAHLAHVEMPWSQEGLAHLAHVEMAKTSLEAEEGIDTCLTSVLDRAHTQSGALGALEISQPAPA